MADSADRPAGDSRPAFTRRELIGGAAGTIGVAAVALAARTSSAHAQTAEGCFFALEIPDFFTGVFAHASGLGSETLIDGGSSEKRTGRTKWGDIVLKRGVDNSLDLVKWRALAEEGRIDEARKTGSITLFDGGGTAVATWNFTNGWPTKVNVSSNEKSDAPCAWESLTLSVESAERVR